MAEQSTSSPDTSLIQSFEVLLTLHMKSDAVELLKKTKNREAVIDDSLSVSGMLFVMISQWVFGPEDTSSLSPLTPTKEMCFFNRSWLDLLQSERSIHPSLSNKAHFVKSTVSCTHWLFQLCVIVVFVYAICIFIRRHSVQRRKFKSMAKTTHCSVASLVLSCLSLMHCPSIPLKGNNGLDCFVDSLPKQLCKLDQHTHSYT